MEHNVQHIFLVGAKNIGTYGGYETFVNKLTEYHQNNSNLKYHIACKANGNGYMDETKLYGAKKITPMEFEYHNAHCFKINVPDIGSAQAILYDIAALKKTINHIKDNNIKNPIVYIMACRIGPFMKVFYKRLKKLGAKVFLNPDGHEWLRGKWSLPVKKYWKISERSMVKYTDFVVCDSINIEKYIHKIYDGKGIKGRSPQTTFIAYGAETRSSQLSDDNEILTNWYKEHNIKANKYYLTVGRFVPENNYKTMIREFMNSNSKKDFVIVTDINNKFSDRLEEELHFRSDKRIKFVGTVYNRELLMKIRENAYGYFHGHEVGGTNPSLLEALSSTDLNLLLDVGFNREVAEDTAMYWNKNEGDLTELINKADKINEDKRAEYGFRAKQRIKNAYSWQYIADRYEELFLRGSL